jgi:hypothetical protein
MGKNMQPAKPAPKMCRFTNQEKDSQGRTIFCNQWLDSSGKCTIHGFFAQGKAGY